jgi:hypothetical protein
MMLQIIHCFLNAPDVQNSSNTDDRHHLLALESDAGEEPRQRLPHTLKRGFPEQTTRRHGGERGLQPCSMRDGQRP